MKYINHFDYVNSYDYMRIACTGKRYSIHSNNCPLADYVPLINKITCPECLDSEEFKKALLDFELKFDGDEAAWQKAFFNE